MSTSMNAPTGIDLYPDHPPVRRLKKRVVILAASIVAGVLLCVVYGIHAKGEHQVKAAEIEPTKVEPASSAGKAVADEVPPGTVPLVPPKNTMGTQSSGLETPQQVDIDMPSAGEVPRSMPIYTHVAQPDVTYERAEDPEQYSRDQEERAKQAATGIGGGQSNFQSNAFSGTPNVVPASQVQILPRSASPGETLTVPLPPQGLGGRAGDQQTEKENFIAQARRERSPSENYTYATRMVPLTKYVITAGWNIPALLEQKVDSDLPGEIRARVREDVRDTATGRYVLIPHDSVLVGHYDSHVTYGQTRLPVVWTRIIFPDGSSIDLDGMLAEDTHGGAGVTWKVNHHYLRLAGMGVLTSLFTAGFQLSQPRQATVLATPSNGQIIAGAVGQNLSQLGTEVTRRNLDIPPTITVPTGYPFDVRVNRDLVFAAPYKPF